MLQPKWAGGAGAKRKAAGDDEPAAALGEAAPGSVEHFAWITLPDTAALVVEGLSAKAPVVHYDKNKKVFSSAHGLLQDMIEGAVSDDVSFEHDDDLTVFPDIVEVLGPVCPDGEAICFCIAKHAKLGRWAVGTGYGWKTRENAAKLSLAIAIAHEAGEIETLAADSDNGDLGAFCLQAGLVQQDQLPEGSKGTGALQYPVYGISLSAASVLTDEKGLSATAPAVVYDSEFTDAFSYGSHMLKDLIGTSVRTIEYIHDPKGDDYQFPEVKQAIIDAGCADECFCVATCLECKVWGVGVAPGWKNREKAAKVALGLALADDKATFEKCIAQYRDFALLCRAAELITADQIPHKKKRWSDDDRQRAMQMDQWAGGKGGGGGWGASGSEWGGGGGKWGGKGGGGDSWSGGGGDGWGIDPMQAMYMMMKGKGKGW